MRPSHAIVDLDALRHNLGVAARRAPGSKNIAVVKANAYGHGMVEAARALAGPADAGVSGAGVVVVAIAGADPGA